MKKLLILFSIAAAILSADTRKTRAECMSLLADSQDAGDISEQDVRDCLEYGYVRVITHADSCTGVTTGVQGDVCIQIDTNTLYTCSTATCNGAGWITPVTDGTGTDDQNAGEVAVTPVGAVEATDVQAAIQELDSEKIANPMTTAEDIIVGGVSGAPGRLAKGSEGQALKIVSGVVAWGTDSTGGSPAFSDVAAGTNTNALVVGTDGSLTYSDTGTINARTLASTTPGSGGLAVLDDANEAAVRTTLGLVIGTNVQAFDAALSALAAGSDFVDFAGPDTTAKTFTLPNADATLVYDTMTGISSLAFGADPGDAGPVRLSNNTGITWEAATPGTDITLKVNASDEFEFSAPINITGTAGPLQLTEIAAPGANGTAGKCNFYIDSTSHHVSIHCNGGSVESYLYSGGDAGTPSALVLTNATGLPAAQVGGASANLDDTDASVEWEDAADLDSDGGISAGAVTTTEVEAELKTRIVSFNIADPETGDDGLFQFMLPTAGTITRVACSVKTGTSVTLNLDERAAATPDTAGTDVLSADIVCDTDQQTSCASGCDVNTITNSGIAARVPVAITIAAVSGTPPVVRGFVEYTVD